MDEESTSVFLLNEEESIKEDEVEFTTDPVLNLNPSIRRRLTYLEKGFQREVYSPLQFIIGEETLTGKIDKVEGEKVFIEIVGEGNEVIAKELASIEEILWRGQPFIEG
ncbi:hypothetical protein ACXYMX_01005 [Sporosarcina sp. CAU 1771]